MCILTYIYAYFMHINNKKKDMWYAKEDISCQIQLTYVFAYVLKIRKPKC